MSLKKTQKQTEFKKIFERPVNSHIIHNYKFHSVIFHEMATFIINETERCTSI